MYLSFPKFPALFITIIVYVENKICYKIYSLASFKFTIPILSGQFSGIKYIHIAVQLPAPSISSCKSETLYSLIVTLYSP